MHLTIKMNVSAQWVLTTRLCVNNSMEINAVFQSKNSHGGFTSCVHVTMQHHSAERSSPREGSCQSPQAMAHSVLYMCICLNVCEC